MKTVKDLVFKNYNCSLEFGEYAQGNVAITLIDNTDGEPVAVATINVDNLHPHEVCIKDYSENQGMYQALLKHGVIENRHRFENTGYNLSPVSYLTEEFKK